MRTILLVDHRVADFDAWLKVYDEVRGGSTTAVSGSSRCCGRLTIPTACSSRTRSSPGLPPRASSTIPSLQEAMGRAGVDGSSVKIEYFDEVESEDV